MHGNASEKRKRMNKRVERSGFIAVIAVTNPILRGATAYKYLLNLELASSVFDDARKCSHNPGG